MSSEPWTSPLSASWHVWTMILGVTVSQHIRFVLVQTQPFESQDDLLHTHQLRVVIVYYISGSEFLESVCSSVLPCGEVICSLNIKQAAAPIVTVWFLPSPQMLVNSLSVKCAFLLLAHTDDYFCTSWNACSAAQSILTGEAGVNLPWADGHTICCGQ